MSRSGPIDDFSWPDQYSARVLTPDGDRLHGYSIEDDLARNYSFVEMIMTALVGEPPSEAVGRALQVTMTFLSAISPGASACHVGGLSRLMGARSSAVLATASLALAEHAREIVALHQPLLLWLNSRSGPPPRTVEPCAHDVDSVAKLRALLAPTGVGMEIFEHDVTRMEAMIGVLHACGLRSAEQLETAIVIARLAPVMAESFATTPLAFGLYPAKVPDFEYENRSEE